MTLDTYTIRIEELENLQWEIGEKIQQLKEKAGFMEDEFSANLEAADSTFQKLITDRVNYDDTEALWKILDKLQALQNDIFASLRG